MDKFKEVFDQIKDTLIARWEQFQETDTYISLREKYDNLPPRGQKAVVFGGFAMAFLILFSIPYGMFTTSQESIVEFEDTKETIEELLTVSQDVKNIPSLAAAMTSADLRQRVDRILAEKGLGKEQITSVSETQFTNPQGSQLIPSQITATGVETNLKKLTIKQVVDIGYDIERISPLVKILNLEMRATPEDVHYYDVQFRVSSFAVAEAPAAAPTNQRSRRQ